MRIALMLTSLGMGGAERQVVSLGERLQARGHAVELVTLMPPLAEEWPTELKVVRLDMTRSPLRIVTGLLRARRVLKEFCPEILHSHTRHANLAARLLRLAGWAPPVITTLHSVRDGGAVRMLAYRATDGLAARTTAVSEAVAAAYTAAGVVGANRTVVIPNAIDVESFSRDAARGARLRKEMGGGSGFVWLAAGRATSAKDYPNLLRAFAAVAKAEPLAELWIAGEGTERLALFSSALAGVRLLGLRRDMAALLDAADAFVLSSAWEGMPLAVGEAMAMEKPVVATRAGGVEELAGDCAMLVPTGDSEALAAAMQRMMQRTREDRAAMGERARMRIVEQFGWQSRLRAWEELYAETMRR